MIKTAHGASLAAGCATLRLLFGLSVGGAATAMAADIDTVLDANGWRLVTDGVMGGVSEGRLTRASRDGRDCWLLAGRVSTANNGGFIQAALEMPAAKAALAGDYTGLRVDLYGNGEDYNVHLRTTDLWLPWQSYRASLTAEPRWQTFELPFSSFEAYKTSRGLRPERLRRVGIVAIGRDFDADVCIGEASLYR